MKRKSPVEGLPPKKRKLNSPTLIDLQDSESSNASTPASGEKFQSRKQKTTPSDKSSTTETITKKACLEVFDTEHQKQKAKNKYKYFGVLFDRRRNRPWRSSRTFNGKKADGGTSYFTVKEAADRSDVLWRALGGDIIKLNFPTHKEKLKWLHRHDQQREKKKKTPKKRDLSVFDFQSDSEKRSPRKPRKPRILRVSSESSMDDVEIVSVRRKGRSDRARRKPKRFDESPMPFEEEILKKKQTPTRGKSLPAIVLSGDESRHKDNPGMHDTVPSPKKRPPGRRKRTPKRHRESDHSDGDFVPESEPAEARHSRRPRRSRKKRFGGLGDEHLYNYWNKFEVIRGNLDGKTFVSNDDGIVEEDLENANLFIVDNLVKLLWKKKEILFRKEKIIFIKAFAHGEGEYVHCYFLYIKCDPTIETTKLSTPCNS